MPKGAKNWVDFWVGFTESVVFCASSGTGREPIRSIKKVLRICATPFLLSYYSVVTIPAHHRYQRSSRGNNHQNRVRYVESN
jgi:hypothetical protein